MALAHRHHFHAVPLRSDAAMNLFSLMFALLLALAFMVLLMLYFEVLLRNSPATPAAEPIRSAAMSAGARPVLEGRV
jgi:hypothetical protein